MEIKVSLVSFYTELVNYKNLISVFRHLVNLYDNSVRNKDVTELYLIKVKQEKFIVADYRINIGDGYYISILIYFHNDFPKTVPFIYYNSENMINISSDNKILTNLSLIGFRYSSSSGLLTLTNSSSVKWCGADNNTVEILNSIRKFCITNIATLTSTCIIDNYLSNSNVPNKNDDNNYSYLNKINISKFILFDELSVEQLQEFILTYSSNESNNVKIINDTKQKPIVNKISNTDNKNPSSKLESDYITSTTVEKLNNNFFEQELNLINKKDICEVIANDLKFIIFKKLKNKINEKINENKTLTQIKSEVFLISEKAKIISTINQKKISDLKEKILDSAADVRLLSQLINEFNFNFSDDNDNNLGLSKAKTFLDKSNLNLEDLPEDIKNNGQQENNLLVSGVYCNLAESKYYDNSFDQSDMSFVSLNTFSNYFSSKVDLTKNEDMNKKFKFRLNSDKNIQIMRTTTLEQCFEFLFYKEPLIGNVIGVEKAFLNQDSSINLVAYLAYLEDLIHVSRKAYEKSGKNFLETMKVIREIGKKIFQIQHLIRKRI